MPDDPIADHRQRTRWRLIGAALFFLGAAGLATWLLRDHPRSLRADFVLIMPAAPEASLVATAPNPPNRPPLEPESSVQPSDPPEVPTAPTRAEAKPAQKLVQVGAYSAKETAEFVRQRLKDFGYPVAITAVKTAGGMLYRVRVGPMNESDAVEFHRRARAQKYEAVILSADSPKP